MQRTCWSLMLMLGVVLAWQPGTFAEEKGEQKEAKETEEKIAPDKLPEAVKKGAAGAVKDLVISGAEKEVKNGKTQYEVKGKSGETYVEIELSEDGTVLKKKELTKEQHEKEEKEDKDDDDKDD